jgi:very-short-patch-repair endonuclease
LVQWNTDPDFLYEDQHAAVYVDGYHHLFPERQKRDHEKTECMEDSGFTVIRFGLLESWDSMIGGYPSIFGKSESN